MLSSRLFGIIKILQLYSARYLKKDLFSKGIITIGDLLSDAGIFVKGVKVLNANLSPVEYFSLMSIVDAIPREWRQMVRQNTQRVPPYMSDTIYLNLDNFETSLLKVSSKLLYKAFKSRNKTSSSNGPEKV